MTSLPSHPLLVALFLTLTLSPHSVTSRKAAPSPAPAPAPEMSPENKKALDKISQQLELSPDQHEQVAGAATKLESGSLSPADQETVKKKLALSPDQQRHTADSVGRMGAGSPLSPEVQEMIKSSLSPARAEKVKQALSPESAKKSKDMEKEMVLKSGMSPEQQKKALGDAEKALTWGNSQLKNILDADSKQAAAKESPKSLK